MEKAYFKVDSMSCNHCESAIKNAVNKIDGVSDCSIYLYTKDVYVDYDEKKVTLDDLKHAIENEGYDVANPANIKQQFNI